MRTDLEELRDEAAGILRRHDVCRASFFGSVASGRARDDSDLDILVEFTGRKTLLDLVALKLDMEEALQRRVDVVTYDSVAPLIREQVFKEQVTII